MILVGKIIVLTVNDTEEITVENIIAVIADIILLEITQLSHSPVLSFPGLEIRLPTQSFKRRKGRKPYPF